MNYRTILVDVDQTTNANQRFSVAAALAQSERAHLVGTAMTGAPRYMYSGIRPARQARPLASPARAVGVNCAEQVTRRGVALHGRLAQPGRSGTAVAAYAC